MNIDILNAYCGNKLVLFPYLAQGRFYIHRTVRRAHWTVVSPVGTRSPGMSFGVHELDSWEHSVLGLESADRQGDR